MALLSIHSVTLMFWNILANFSGFRVTLLLRNIATLRLWDITTLFLVSVSGWLANLLVNIPALLAVDGIANLLVTGRTGFSVGSLNEKALDLEETMIFLRDLPGTPV